MKKINELKIIIHVYADLGSDSKPYGEKYTKRTSLWGYFNLPKKPWTLREKLKGRSKSDIITPMTHKDKEERMHARSLCSEKFAKAFFYANQ